MKLMTLALLHLVGTSMVQDTGRHRGKGRQNGKRQWGEGEMGHWERGGS